MGWQHAHTHAHRDTKNSHTHASEHVKHTKPCAQGRDRTTSTALHGMQATELFLDNTGARCDIDPPPRLRPDEVRAALVDATTIRCPITSASASTSTSTGTGLAGR